MLKKKIYGPFKQVITMRNLPRTGPIADNDLEIIPNACVITNNGIIEEITHCVGPCKMEGAEFHEITEPSVLMPGFVDAHTHICYGGTRRNDFAMRLQGKSYLDIAEKGGGIYSSVKSTRATSQERLEKGLFERAITHMRRGVTTCEVKSGYGLDVDTELKMLRAINNVELDLIPTCLAAHSKAPDFDDPKEYLDHIVKDLLPKVMEEGLSKRVDIFVEDTAFEPDLALEYLKEAKRLGFSITVHADQFTQGGSEVAAEIGAVSADHLEVADIAVVEKLIKHDVVGVVLPGASLGLGMDFAPARMMLDNNLCVAIASDWNPGSAPMGDLLVQAAALATNQRLTTAETLAGMTVRGARALELEDRAKLTEGMLADMIAFPTEDYRDILYYQGMMKPHCVWKCGELMRQ